MFYEIDLPSRPKIIKEDDFSGIYEIEGLYPGYGHTLGNSLRRIILSSLPGAAITSVKIEGVNHEFSTIEGIREDVITIILNLKRVRIKMLTDETQTMRIKTSGEKVITAKDIETPGQVEILNPEQIIAHLVDKKSNLDMEITVQKGLGYVPKEAIQKERVDIGVISLDATFSPIRRVNYEVEDMRVGNKTNFNRMRIFIETDGTMTPHQVLEESIKIMIYQLKAIVGFQEEEEEEMDQEGTGEETTAGESKEKIIGEIDKEFLKTRVESLGLSKRAENALAKASIRTVGGLTRKKEEDLLQIEGLGKRGIGEIKNILRKKGIELKTGE